MVNIKKMLSLLLVGVLSVGIFTGCGKEEEVEQPVYALQALTADQLEAGKYYVKNGDTFYALPSGTHNFEDKNAIIKENKVVDTTRVIWFGGDDVTIPTLYADDTLVYVTQTLPDSFTWERYKDNGYTVGVSGLTVSTTGAYSVVMESPNFYPESSMKTAIATSGSEVNDILVVDKVDGFQIGNGNVSDGGTILGLQSGKTYSVDVYNGSKYIPLENIEADTHAFSAFEVYTSSICNYMQANYIQVVVPDNFVSGYYYINGTGFVRYVDNARSKGIAEVDFNAPYYFTDADGVTHTRDELGEDGQIIVNEEKYYSNITNVDCSNNSIQIDVHYDDAKGVNIDGSEFVYSDAEVGLPQVKLIDPEGNDNYVFVNSNSEEKTLTIKVDNPLPGTWETRIYNAEKRMFNVTTSFVSGHNDTLIHNGDKAEIVYYVPQTMKNAQFTINWANTTVSPKFDNGVVIKDGKINDPEGKNELTFTRESITVADTQNYQEARGVIKMNVGEIKYGDYTITLDSDYALGRVRVSVIDLDAGQLQEELGDLETEESLDATVEESEKSEDSEESAESDNKKEETKEAEEKDNKTN